MIGILPQQLWDMELWEFNACIKAYNWKQMDKGREQLAVSWQTAAFVGAAFGGKLKRLSHYLKDNIKIEAPKISKEEFEEKLRHLEGRMKHGT